MANKNDKPLYVQIIDGICDKIISGEYEEGGRIPSVREYSASFGVNINTTCKAFDQLARQEIIYNKRGLGYYISSGAIDKIKEERRKEFFSSSLPEMFRQMKMLDIPMASVIKSWENNI